MKILYATMQLGRSYSQGTERYVTTLAEAMRGRGHDVAFLAGDPLGLDTPRQLGEGVDDGVLPGPLYAMPTRGWMSVTGMPVRPIVDWLRANCPDLIHIANPAHIGTNLVAAARQLGVPVVITTMDFWWVCPKATLLRPGGELCDGTPGWRTCVQCMAGGHASGAVRTLGRLPEALAPVTLLLYLARAGLRGMSPADMRTWTRRRAHLAGVLNDADYVIFPSRATEGAIRPLIRHERCGVLPYGLPDGWFADPRPPRTGPIDPADMVVGYAGAMLPHKAPHLLLEAVRRLGWTRTRVRLAGAVDDSPYGRQLRRTAEGLNVEFAGQLSPADMRAFIRSLDVLAMTSVWPENLPFIVLEAQAAGVPVVGSRLAGVAEQLGSASLAFEPGSAEGLAEALEFVRAHPAQVRLRQVARLEDVAARTEEIYARVLAGNSM